MTKWIVIVVVLLFVAVTVRLLATLKRKSKRVYQYERRDHLMTRAERECYQTLVAAMGEDYWFFPQVHLDGIVIPKTSGTDRFHAFRHINQKSVDFVACDKKLLHPVFAVELDDRTHNLPRRMERDREVERILHGAAIPLIRIQNHGRFDPMALAQAIQKEIERHGTLSSKTNSPSAAFT